MVVIDPYESLANEIVMTAVSDYRDILAAHAEKIRRPGGVVTKKSLENFFLSDWFMLLTDVDGKVVLEKLKKDG